MSLPGPHPGTPQFWFLLCGLLAAAGTAAAAEPPTTLAAALREPGLVLIADCGEGRPHRTLADKVAGDLHALRGEAPERLGCDDLQEVHWEDAHLVVIASDPRDPAVVAVAGGLDLRADGSGLQVAGVALSGADAAAAVTLPHPRAADRWALLLLGTGPEALRRLDRHIRNDVAASALVLDDSGERMMDIVLGDGGWVVPAGHPYRAAEVESRAAAWLAETGARVTSWTTTVAVDPGAAVLDVTCRVELERGARRGPGGRTPEDLWLLLSPRAEIRSCTGRGIGSCVRHDARDGTIRLHIEARHTARFVDLVYRLPLDGRLDAWYIGPAGGYVMPEANWLPRVRGSAEEAYAERGALTVELTAPGDVVQVDAPGDGDGDGGGTAPVLVWGTLREVVLEGDARAYLAPEAPAAVQQRATALLDAVGRWGPARAMPQVVVAVPCPRAWIGEGLLLAPPDLMEPGPVDQRSQLALERAATEELVRLQPPGGRMLRVEGVVAQPGPPVTARLWRLRGRWWEQIDEGPLGEGGVLALTGKGKLPLLVSVEADGHLPGFAPAAPGEPVQPALRPVEEVALVCLRCGPGLGAVRYPMAQVEPGCYAVDIALGEIHRRYGTFPYAFELEPGQPDAALVLDPVRPRDQFPSFLIPEEFHADVVHFELCTDEIRFWIEVPGGLLAPAEWIGAEEAGAAAH